MKKVFLLFALLCAFTTASFAQQGDQSVGVRLNYGNDTNMGIGVNYRYTFTDNWRVEPAFDYYFENDGVSFWSLGANAHYLFPLANQVSIYPLAGLGYTHAKPKGIDGEGKISINMGCGVDYRFASNITFNAEAKYMIIDNYNQLVISAGLAFSF